MADHNSIPDGRKKSPEHALAKEMLATTSGALDGIGKIAKQIIQTKMVPLHYAPWLFCGCAGDPQSLPIDGASVGRCLIKWAIEIARAVIDHDLLARDQDSWMILRADDQITAQSLVSWAELEQWAFASHGLSSGWSAGHGNSTAPEIHQPHGHTKNKEQRAKACLGHALATLVAYPDECIGRKGKVTADAIAAAIENHAAQFFPDGKVPLSHERLTRLLAGWIKKRCH